MPTATTCLNNFNPPTSVRFTTPVNYTSTVANQGKDDAIDSDADPISHQTEVTTLAAGENDLSWDYGIYLSSDVESPKCSFTWQPGMAGL